MGLAGRCLLARPSHPPRQELKTDLLSQAVSGAASAFSAAPRSGMEPCKQNSQASARVLQPPNLEANAHAKSSAAKCRKRTQDLLKFP